MTTHASIEAGTSQCALILGELEKHAGEWVDMPRLVKVSGAYAVHSRAADLRKRGHQIDQRNVFAKRSGKRVVKSQYRLVQDAEKAS